jgi:hypothetical protein
MVYYVKNIFTGEVMLEWDFEDIRDAKRFCEDMNEQEGFKSYKIVKMKAYQD